MKMVVVYLVYVLHELEINVDRCFGNANIGVLWREFFKRKCKWLLRKFEHKWPTWILLFKNALREWKLFNFLTEEIEYQKFKEINQKLTTMLGIKPFCTTPSSLLPILFHLYHTWSSGNLWWFQIIDGDKFTTFGIVFLYHVHRDVIQSIATNCW